MNNSRTTADPVRVGDYNAVAKVSTPRAFAASLVDKTDEQLDKLLAALEGELAEPNAPGRVRRELDEVAWEVERRRAARRTRERRQANIAAQHNLNRQEADPGPPVFVQGRRLDARDLQNLDARIAWVLGRTK